MHLRDLFIHSITHRVWVGALAIGASLTSSPLYAQADTARADTTKRLNTVVVRAARAPMSIGGASAVVAPLDSLRLTPGAPLEAVIRQLPFVLVRQNSRGEAELSIRGSDTRQAAILFDGMPITLGWDSRSDPSVFPLSGAGSIVLVRGLSTLLQGPNTLGGVLELGVVSNRAQPVDATRMGFQVGVDQVGAQGYQADVARPFQVGNASLTLRAGGAFRDRNAVALSGDVNDQYARNRRRANSDLSQREGYIAARYGTSDGAWIGANLSGYSLERGVMPELHIQAPRFWRYPEQNRQLALLSMGTGRRSTPLGAGDMEVVVGTNGSYTRIENYLNARYDSIVGLETGDERTTTVRLLADHSLGRGEVRTSFTLANIRYDEGLGAAAPLRYSQRLWSSAFEAEQPLTGTWRLTAGAALDVATNPLTGGKPSLGRLSEWGGRVGLSTLAFGSWRLHASASRRARFAALRELYSGALNRFEPNPTLRPELLTGAEVGATLLGSRVQLQGVLFSNRLNDAVVRITQPDRRFKRVNRDVMRSTGLELLAGWGVGRLRASSDALIQHVRIEDPAAVGTGRRPENQPAFRLGTDVTLDMTAGLSSRLSIEHSGAQYCVNPDLGANQRLRSQTLTGAGLERVWSFAQGALSRFVASLSIDNLFDSAVFDQCGLPQPGRTLRLGFGVN